MSANQATSETSAPPQGAGIELKGIGKRYGSGSEARAALSDVSLSIRPGSFTAVVGRSGSGKSTLLRIIAGLVVPTDGAVLHDGTVVQRPRPDVRYVFQDYGQSLFPWRRVASNVAFGAKHGGVGRGERHSAVQRALDMVGLPEVGRKYPWELSGGMQQRVAIARALASRPRVLLMDEPFGAVDALSRATLQDVLLDVWQQLELTIVLVTHDIEEAVYLADRVLAMDPGGAGFGADVAIRLSRPRSQVQTRESEEFLHHRRELVAAVTEV